MSKWKIKKTNAKDVEKKEQEHLGLVALEELEANARDRHMPPNEQVAAFIERMIDAYTEALGEETTVHLTTALYARAMERITFSACAEEKATVHQYAHNVAYIARVFAECMQVLATSRVTQMEKEQREEKKLVIQ